MKVNQPFPFTQIMRPLANDLHRFLLILSSRTQLCCNIVQLVRFHTKPQLVSIFFVLSHPNCASSQIIMWMLKQERGMIDIMFKINQFFPSRLPQYQNQCVSLCVCTLLSVLKC